jgi:hypothetical protein
MITRLKLLAVAASSFAVTGCVTPYAGANGLYASPIGNAPVTANPTPYSTALVCMANYARASGGYSITPARKTSKAAARSRRAHP